MIITNVVDLLKETLDVADLVADRIYPMSWPDAPEYPLVIVQKAAGSGEADTQGDAGIERARVQIDVYSDRGYSSMEEIRTAVRRRLHAFKGGPAAAPCAIDASFCINDSDMPVPEVERAGPRLRRRMLEFDMWSTEV